MEPRPIAFRYHHRFGIRTSLRCCAGRRRGSVPQTTPSASHFPHDGQPTEAIKTWINVQYALEQYPVLDEDHYSQIEHEATCENVQMQTSYICRKHDLDYSDELAGQVHEWLSEHKPGSLESRDDQGGYPDDEEIEEALEALGLLVTVDSE